MHFPRQPDSGRRGPDVRLVDQEPAERGRAPAVPRRVRPADSRARSEDPDPMLRKDEATDHWVYTEPDWDKFREVDWPRPSQDRIDSAVVRASTSSGSSGCCSRRPRDLRGLSPGTEGPAVRPRWIGDGALTSGSPRSTRASSTAAARSRAPLARAAERCSRDRRVSRRVRPQVPPCRRLLDQGATEGGTRTCRNALGLSSCSSLRRRAPRGKCTRLRDAVSDGGNSEHRQADRIVALAGRR